MKEKMIVSQVFKPIKKHILMIAIITAITTAGTVLYSTKMTSEEYTATTKLLVGKVNDGNTEYSTGDVSLFKSLLATYPEIIQTKELISDALDNTKYEDVSASSVLNNMSVSSVYDTQVLTVSYTSNDAEQSANILKLVANEFIDYASDMVANSSVTIIDPVEVPTSAVNNNFLLKVIAAVLVGLMAGTGIAYLREYYRNTYENKEKLEKEVGIPVLAVIPYSNNRGGK